MVLKFSTRIQRNYNMKRSDVGFRYIEGSVILMKLKLLCRYFDSFKVQNREHVSGKLRVSTSATRVHAHQNIYAGLALGIIQQIDFTNLQWQHF